VKSRRRPELLVVVPLEGVPSLFVYSETYEDEARLRIWLRVSRTPEVLAWIVLQLLDELDETERAA
jgi:hypothetical protein